MTHVGGWSKPPFVSCAPSRAAVDTSLPTAAALTSPPPVSLASQRIESGSRVGQIFSAELGGELPMSAAPTSPAPLPPPEPIDAGFVRARASTRASAADLASESTREEAVAEVEAAAANGRKRKSETWLSKRLSRGGGLTRSRSRSLGGSRPKEGEITATAAVVQPTVVSRLPPPEATNAEPVSPGRAALLQRPRRATALMAAKWNAAVDKTEAELSVNVFSSKFDKSKLIRKGDEGYGKAVAGSQTEARAKKAQQWVDAEIEKLLGVIEQHGQPTGDAPSAARTITFGVLFHVYADISDTLVGILMRAKKRKRVAYDSDMLFQGVHDDVVIRVL